MSNGSGQFSKSFVRSPLALLKSNASWELKRALDSGGRKFNCAVVGAGWVDLVSREISVGEQGGSCI